MATSSTPTHASVTSLTLQPGDRVGDYTILERIGSGGGVGGGSAVYAAQDRLVARRVAIKQVLPPVNGNPAELADKVRREARVQKRIASRHPDRLVQVLDVLQDDRGRGVMLVTEFIDGRTLEAVLQSDREPMEPRRGLGVVASIARALEAIHAGDDSGTDSGPVIHRDLKPANVFLPEGGGLKVGDFGLAAAVAEQDTLSLGSVRYMSPELLRGERADVRADLYSLGVIAYEVLAGRERFEEAFRFVLRDERNRAMRWMKWHTNPRAKAPPLSQIAEGTHPAVSDLVSRLMEKAPEDRPASAGEVVEMVRRAVVKMEAGPGTTTPAGAATPGLSDADAGAAVGHTAPLPVGGSSRLLPILLSLSLGILTCTAGVLGYELANRVDPEVVARDARGESDLQAAIALWQDGELTEAIDAFEDLERDWEEDTQIGDTARAGLLWSRSDLALRNDNYQEAIAIYATLGSMGEKTNRSLVYPRDTTDLETLEELDVRVRNEENFERAMRRILSMASDTDGTAGALAELEQWQEQGLAEDLTPEQRARVASIASQIEGREADWSKEDALRQARALHELGNPDSLSQAIALLGRHIARTADPDAEVVSLHEAYQAEAALQAARAEASRAERGGDTAAAIKAYEALAVLAPDDLDAIQATLASLRSELALSQGEAALAAGETDEARRRFLESLGHQPNPRAEAALKAIADRAALTGVLDAAREADAEGRWDDAIRGYREAIALGADAGLQSRVSELEALTLLTRAKDAIAMGNLEEAQRLLVDARRGGPGQRRHRRRRGDARAASALQPTAAGGGRRPGRGRLRRGGPHLPPSPRGRQHRRGRGPPARHRVRLLRGAGSHRDPRWQLAIRPRCPGDGSDAQGYPGGRRADGAGGEPGPRRRLVTLLPPASLQHAQPHPGRASPARVPWTPHGRIQPP